MNKEKRYGDYILKWITDAWTRECELCLFECNVMAHPTWIATFYTPKMAKHKSNDKEDAWELGIVMAKFLAKKGKAQEKARKAKRKEHDKKIMEARK